MKFPYICKELLAKYFALGKHLIVTFIFQTIITELKRCPLYLFTEYLLSSYYHSNHSSEKEDNVPDIAICL